MKKLLFLFSMTTLLATAQEKLTPELLWSLGRVSASGISKDGRNIIYTVGAPDISGNRVNRTTYMIPIAGGAPVQLSDTSTLLRNTHLSPDGRFMIYDSSVKVNKVFGKDYYPDLQKSTAQIYDQLSYRHWDEWEDGAFNHVILKPSSGSGIVKDIMSGLAYDAPQKPFGGDEDYIWSPDSRYVLYVTKPKTGTAYAVSTNTDIFQYDIQSGSTINLTEGMMGYDVAPEFSSRNVLAWLSMKRDGFEADKNDIVILENGRKVNLTEGWDGTVESFKWSADGSKIYFQAPVGGTIQLFELTFVPKSGKPGKVRQITDGVFDIASLVGQKGNSFIVTRTDMNHAAEIFSVDLLNGSMKQLTHVNDDAYSKIAMSRLEKRMIPTTDGRQMTVWVIYPPGFDAAKKYPTLLYCQGGPQSALTQFYSFRWNFQLMAANGYIIVAPNRRGMPGHGVEWNEKISKDWGGQVMDDYLSAIDAVSKENYVDRSRLGCVGASYGGYSAYYLAGIHKGRFKTFIAHDGVFDLRSMSGTTEELWFTHWDFGGNYWERDNKDAQQTFSRFNPSDLVASWTSPILIIQGGKDYRVPIEQGLQAFQAAQLRGIKSRLLYLPDENHWVLKAQNALVWQREFFRWLSETL